MANWGREHLRSLPWRATRDPWAILVAETMLQQTPVERVLPRYVTFLERFPDPVACAEAPLAEILRVWQGLGYPRRAQRLQSAARAVVERFEARVPVAFEDLISLAGIGPYTARAVRAFAHEEPAAVVDTNVARVLARVTGVRLTPRRAQDLADSWADEATRNGEVWTWNQTIMELGALVCRPTPRCETCPLADHCTWSRAGRPEPDPARGSAGVSGSQARFEGSVRQARGRILAALGATAAEGLARDRIAEVTGREPAQAAAILDGLVTEGLVEVLGDRVRLPGEIDQGAGGATTASTTTSKTSSA